MMNDPGHAKGGEGLLQPGADDGHLALTAGHNNHIRLLGAAVVDRPGDGNRFIDQCLRHPFQICTGDFNLVAVGIFVINHRGIGIGQIDLEFLCIPA